MDDRPGYDSYWIVPDAKRDVMRHTMEVDTKCIMRGIISSPVLKIAVVNIDSDMTNKAR